MTKNYILLTLSLISLSFLFFSCNDDDSYEEIPTTTEVVTVDLSQVPYSKLSDYHFFEGQLKDLTPSVNVLPYAPASPLFSDYAHKKRFVWMPSNKKATYNEDYNILELPVGAVLIKSFYYDNVQPSNNTKLIETRLMIRKESGWIFADYIWNEEQTEAFHDLNGSYKNIQWKDENNNLKSVNYRVPNEVQCITCHKSRETINGQSVDIPKPIGIKPQNLNFEYSYGNTTKNQLSKWIEQGYLENNFSLPSQDKTTIDYNDTSKPIDLRARSYVDINCAHCHRNNSHCDYRPMRFAFHETGDVTNGLTNMGVCVNTSDMQNFPNELNKVVTPENIDASMLYYRINTTDESYRMPLHGRTLIHTEGVLLMKDWINTLRECN
ncbi:hypothetical protein FIA58_018680 [Flavobacterium jejuense]|uniref:Repeat protein (TIGR03806 family) n=1 Tax=Flavobacterium jejuense TaxID=1544455 RepID=A0ABX0IV04_9FLAO|nr:hypothetical protein [Flavobacterium jejuense]NHN27712.1 hypothetical protein [Flavobacterium jejuense]